MDAAVSAVRADFNAGAAFSARARTRWTIFALVGTALLVAAFWAAGDVARYRAVAVLRQDATASALLHEAVLRSELEKQRSTPLVLAADLEVVAVATARDAARARDLSRRVVTLAH